MSSDPTFTAEILAEWDGSSANRVEAIDDKPESVGRVTDDVVVLAGALAPEGAWFADGVPQGGDWLPGRGAA